MATPDPAHRYVRQQLLDGFGPEGQGRLAASHALVVGCGALGTVAAESLVRAGVGTLTIVDRDLVELSNLQRQTLFTEADAQRGVPKAEAARERLADVNSTIRVIAAIADFTHRNAERLAGVKAGDARDRAGVIVDATDNVETRLLMNDVAVAHAIPLVYAGAVGTEAMSMTILPKGGDWAGTAPTPCFRCVFPDPPPPGAMPTCDAVGVLGPVAGMVANLAAIESLKILLGRFDLISRSLLRFDPWKLERQRIDVAPLARGDDCPCCGQRRFEWLAGTRAAPAAVLCGRDAVQVGGAEKGSVDLKALGARLAPHGRFSVTPFSLRGELAAERSDATGAPLGLTVFADGRTIVAGTTRPDRARAIVAKYIGA